MSHSIERPRPLSGASESLDAALVAIAAELRGARHVVVVSHKGPDGDAIASTLACAAICDAMGTPVTAFNVDPVPVTLRFLPGASRIVHELPEGLAPDVVLVLDCTGRDRVGERAPDALWNARVLCLDHHATWDPTFAHVIARDESAASTTELAYRLAVACAVPLTPDLATCIFAGLHTDTGSFRYGCTIARTMELGSLLLETGISTWDVASSLYENDDEVRVRLLGRVLSTLRRSPCGRLALLVVTQEDLAALGADMSHADGFINHARGIRGVEVAVQLTEVGPEEYRASLRSRGHVDVSRIAAHFGGGGHRNAAGCTLPWTLETSSERLFEAIGWAADPGAA